MSIAHFFNLNVCTYVAHLLMLQWLIFVTCHSRDYHVSSTCLKVDFLIQYFNLISCYHFSFELNSLHQMLDSFTLIVNHGANSCMDPMSPLPFTPHSSTKRSCPLKSSNTEHLNNNVKTAKAKKNQGQDVLHLLHRKNM